MEWLDGGSSLSIWWLIVVECSIVTGRRTSAHNLHNENITELLDSLLRGYNKHLRPDFGVSALEVVTNILIRSMGPVSEEDMMFSMDCYFRQTWRDVRLSFVPYGNITELRPSIKMLDEIWKPDTYFLNGQGSYLHTITYHNKLFRINTTGNILYSQRLTIKSTCPMYLHKYPLDVQNCPLMIGSYGYSSRDVVYKWLSENDAVKKYTDIAMSQFTLTKIEYGNKTTGENHGSRTALFVEFELKREIGYYLLQIYLPCYLIVIISWVSFWINREAAPARVTLGITTLLTTSTIGLTGRAGIPKVSYSTALDIFLLMCFSFVFAALVEYAGVNYFTKGGQKDFQEDSEGDIEEETTLINARTYFQQPNVSTSLLQGAPPSGPDEEFTRQVTTTTDLNGRGWRALDPGSRLRERRRFHRGGGGEAESEEMPTEERHLAKRLRRLSCGACDCRNCDGCERCSGCELGNWSAGCGWCWTFLCTCLRGSRRYDSMRRWRGGAGVGQPGGVNSVSRVDSLSRVVFPFSFVCLNILYWAGFLYYF